MREVISARPDQGHPSRSRLFDLTHHDPIEHPVAQVFSQEHQGAGEFPGHVASLGAAGGNRF